MCSANIKTILKKIRFIYHFCFFHILFFYFVLLLPQKIGFTAQLIEKHDNRRRVATSAFFFLFFMIYIYVYKHWRTYPSSRFFVSNQFSTYLFYVYMKYPPNDTHCVCPWMKSSCMLACICYLQKYSRKNVSVFRSL